jgi:hypothetical protein
LNVISRDEHHNRTLRGWQTSARPGLEPGGGKLEERANRLFHIIAEDSLSSLVDTCHLVVSPLVDKALITPVRDFRLKQEISSNLIT